MGGVFAAFGVLALRRRVERGGPGEHLDLSMLEALTAMQSSEWLHSQLLRVPPIRRTTEVPSIEPAKDGYVGITMVTGQQWLDFAAMVECPQLEEIEQLRFQIGRWQYRDLIRELIHPWLAERTVAEIVELGQLFRLPIAALGNGSTIRDLEYVRERDVFVENPAGFHQPRPPWLMSACAPAPVGDTPPLARQTVNYLGAETIPVPLRTRRCRRCRWPGCASSTSPRFGQGRRQHICWPRSAPTWSRSNRSSAPTASGTPVACAPMWTTGGSTAGCSTR